MSNWHCPMSGSLIPIPAQRRIAIELYETVAGLPLVCPHGHIDPWLLADEEATFGTPADLLIIPDHYVFRMLYSQGISMESLGVPRVDGGPVEQDHRKIWQTFADHFYLFPWHADRYLACSGIERSVWHRDQAHRRDGPAHL